MARTDIAFRPYWDSRADQRGIKIDYERQPIFDHRRFQMDRAWQVVVHVREEYLPRDYHIETMASVVRACQIYRGRHVNAIFHGMLMPYAKQVFEIAYDDNQWGQAVIVLLRPNLPR